MRFYARLRIRTFGSGSSFLTLATVCLLTTGCFGQNAAVEEPPRPTIRQVRAEWRRAEAKGLLPALRDPLTTEEDFAARFGSWEGGRMSHPREVRLALARLRETVDQIESEDSREAFLAADRERDPTRADALRDLFAWRFDDEAHDDEVWKEFERLDQAYAKLEQDAWVQRQRLLILRAMLDADQARSTPRLLEALRKGEAKHEEDWRWILGDLPEPSTAEGRPIWTAIAEENLEAEGEIAYRLLDALSDFDEMAGIPHPFDDEAGMKRFEAWLRSSDPHDFRFQRETLENAKHLRPDRAEALYRLGEDHPSKRIQAIALGEGCDEGRNARRVRLLRELCEDERYAGIIRANLREMNLDGDQETDPSSLSAMRERAFWIGAVLRYDLDSTPEEMALLAAATVPWKGDDEVVRVFRYRLPEHALLDPEPGGSRPGGEGVRSSYEDVAGYLVINPYESFSYSEEEVRSKGYETALEVAALALREEEGEYGSTPLPDAADHAKYVDDLAEEDWRWGELRVSLEKDEESSFD